MSPLPLPPTTRLHGRELVREGGELYRPYSLDVRVEVGLEPQRAVRAVPELLYMVEQYGAKAAANLRVCVWGGGAIRGGVPQCMYG